MLRGGHFNTVIRFRRHQNAFLRRLRAVVTLHQSSISAAPWRNRLLPDGAARHASGQRGLIRNSQWCCVRLPFYHAMFTRIAPETGAYR